MITRLASPTLADVADINALLAQLAPEAPALTHAQLSALTASPHHDLLVTKNAQQHIIGMALVVIVAKLSGVQAWIEDVVVDKDYRSQGLGEALMQAAMQSAKTHGATQVDLTSRPSRLAANKLYLRLGFEKRETNVYRKQI